MKGSLTVRRARFVEEYIIDLNATQAALRAGFSIRTARSQAQRLLTNVDIQAAITNAVEERSKRTEINADWVIQKLRENIERALQIRPVLSSAASGRKRAARTVELTPCACGNTEGLQRHHIDGNTWNTDQGNIEVLCQTCHTATHVANGTWGRGGEHSHDNADDPVIGEYTYDGQVANRSLELLGRHLGMFPQPPAIQVDNSDRRTLTFKVVYDDDGIPGVAPAPAFEAAGLDTPPSEEEDSPGGPAFGENHQRRNPRS